MKASNIYLGILSVESAIESLNKAGLNTEVLVLVLRDLEDQHQHYQALEIKERETKSPRDFPSA